MKTERRQELRSNDLSAFLGDAGDWVKSNVGTIGVSVVVLVVVIGGASVFQKSRNDAVASSWDRLSALTFAPDTADASFAELKELIGESSDRDFRQQAYLAQATRAMNLAVRDTEFRPAYLDQAEEAYRELLDGYPDRVPIAAAALSGLAAVEESRFVVDGDASHRGAAEGYLGRLQNEPRFRETVFQTNATQQLLAMSRTFQNIKPAPALPPPVPVEPIVVPDAAVEVPSDATDEPVDALPSGDETTDKP